MPETKLKMPLKVAKEIVNKYEKDYNNDIVAYPDLKKDLDIARKVLYDHYIAFFRKMK